MLAGLSPRVIVVESRMVNEVTFGDSQILF